MVGPTVNRSLSTYKHTRINGIYICTRVHIYTFNVTCCRYSEILDGENFWFPGSIISFLLCFCFCRVISASKRRRCFPFVARRRITLTGTTRTRVGIPRPGFGFFFQEFFYYYHFFTVCFRPRNWNTS